MLVKNWMSTGVLSIAAEDSIQKAIRLQKENSIHILPVIEKEKLVGVVTDRDIKRASMSDTIPLDINEAAYLASKIKVKDVMTPHPFTVPPDHTVEEAAGLLLKCGISSAPVVDKEGKIVGIITRSDALRVLISLTGGNKLGYLFAFRVEDKPGSVTKVVNLIREHGGRTASILSTDQNTASNYRNVYIRVYDMPPETFQLFLKQLKEIVTVRYVIDFILNKREIFES